MLVLALPTGDAQPLPDERLEFVLSPGAVEVIVSRTYDASDAPSPRARIDAAGRPDGNVEASEVESFGAASRREGSHDPSCLRSIAAFTADARAAHRFEATWLAHEDAAGPVVSTQPVVERTHFRYEFPAGPESAWFRFRLADWRTDDAESGCRSDPFDARFAHGFLGSGESGPPARVLVRAADGFVLEPTDLDGLAAFWNGRALLAEGPAPSAQLRDAAIEARVHRATPETSAGAAVPDVEVPAGSGPRLAWAAFGLTLAALAAWRKGWTRLVLLAAFSRFSRGETLRHPRRQEILHLIEADPGVCLADVRRTTGLRNGTLRHHLRILGAKGYVRTLRDGRRTRLFPAGVRLAASPYVTEPQRRLLDLVRQRPGLTQTDLMAHVGGPRHAVSYQLRRLEALGLVRATAAGPWRRYHPAPFASSG